MDLIPDVTALNSGDASLEFSLYHSLSVKIIPKRLAIEFTVKEEEPKKELKI